MEDNGYHLGVNTIKLTPNEHRKSFPLKDSNENIIDRVDKGYRVNGQVVVNHVRNWFNDRLMKNKKEKK
ncbi:hypothetical protein OD350_09590 [Clostridium beijerinckii]|uniref:hypothetical protein n=1 Tax=Clostridium beijerinckii TaxID=1520 RepID=UPI002226F818|nr:hypothetical protein [Clostridium beijerinckii]UYZ37898.1 hypothetical protein OD350_09590 [Clostridium beijerinckii]